MTEADYDKLLCMNCGYKHWEAGNLLLAKDQQIAGLEKECKRLIDSKAAAVNDWCDQRGKLHEQIAEYREMLCAAEDNTISPEFAKQIRDLLDKYPEGE